MPFFLSQEKPFYFPVFLGFKMRGLMRTICIPEYPLLIALQLVVTGNPVDRTVTLLNLAHTFLHFNVINSEVCCRWD